jgi:hypothetical protein
MPTRLHCIVLALAMCSACITMTDLTYAVHVKSSDGESFNKPAKDREPYAADHVYAAAVLHSAAHDIPCQVAEIRVQNAYAPSPYLKASTEHFVADGCGRRVIYECPLRGTTASRLQHVDWECQMVLVNRFEVPPT